MYSKQPDADGYKIRAFSNAIKVIERLDKPITSGKEAMRLRGIGMGISGRISAFLDTQQEINNPRGARLEKDRSQIAREELMRIPGFGFKKAQELIDAGCKSLADLRSRKFLPMISKRQKIIVRYLEHMNKPITREEADIVAKFMRENLSSKYEIVIAGDYRRGLSSLPRLDIVVLHTEHVYMPIPDPPQGLRRRLMKSPATKNKYFSISKKMPNPLHGDLVPNLTNRGLICDTTLHADRKWSGIIRIPELVEGVGPGGERTMVWREKHERIRAIASTEGTFRQMNVVLTPQKARPTTLLAMTGDPEFVKYLRYRALSLGLHLDEFGLWKWHSNGDSTANANPSEDGSGAAVENNDQEGTGYWELMQVSVEEDIFSILGMEYVQPERRNFGYLKTNRR
ncbi:hypothetical protein AX15_001043 [Amanita polypyramis BW_CC]|nr:hypothetical protein AX15_001043 [Amanita polypyramis BW_CC]